MNFTEKNAAPNQIQPPQPHPAVIAQQELVDLVKRINDEIVMACGVADSLLCPLPRDGGTKQAPLQVSGTLWEAVELVHLAELRFEALRVELVRLYGIG